MPHWISIETEDRWGPEWHALFAIQVLRVRPQTLCRTLEIIKISACHLRLASTALIPVIDDYRIDVLSSIPISMRMASIPTQLDMVFQICVTTWNSCLCYCTSSVPLVIRLREFKSVLNEERQHNATLHEQIEAVESMIERQNHGQGFGIPVFDGFVIAQGWLQMICIRFAILATAIKAFLDTELGYAKEPEQVLMPHLKDMQNQLNNLTTMLRNYTNHTWHLAQQEKRGPNARLVTPWLHHFYRILMDFALQKLWISDCSWDITLDANDPAALSRRSIIGRMKLPTITWYKNALNCN